MPPMVSGFLDAPGTVRELALAHRTAVSLGRFHLENLSIVLREDRRAMPRQRTDHSRMVYVFPDDFPRRLERFKEKSGLSWAELARRLGTSTLNLRRWKDKGVRPNWRHLVALLELAEELGLGHLFTAWTVREETRREIPAPAVPSQHRSPSRKAAGRPGR